MSNLDSQTRELLLDYLTGPVSLDEMRRAFMRLAWGLDSEEVIRANPLTAQTSLFLAEYGAGHRDETELRELLGSLLGTVRISYAVTAVSWQGQVSRATQTQAAQWPQLVVADR